MPALLYVNEIVEFAVEREQESVALYQELAERVDDREIKGFFESLMAEERAHQEYYTGLLSKTATQRRYGMTENDEDDAYMRVLIDSRRTVAAPPLDINHLDEILDFAIAREKDAVLFYVGLENYVPEQDREMITTIIKEEGRHIVKLTDLKKQL